VFKSVFAEKQQNSIIVNLSNETDSK